jgi:hypothetical protein
MGIKSILSKPFANWIANKVKREVSDPISYQDKILKIIIENGKKTNFGKTFNFQYIKSYQDFQSFVPLTDYEGIKPWIDLIAKGGKNVLWPGIPLYFAKTSGTTSGVKYIPITRDSIHNHIDTTRNALLMYIDSTDRRSFVDHKMIFIQGSPLLERYGEIDTGRLSGIAAHYVPGYLQKNRLPSWKTNCINDWETKIDHIVSETVCQRMSLIGGIPSWLRMYFEKLVEKTGRPVGDLFPDLQLIVYGGVNYEPYRSVFDKLIGRVIDTIELFPASEGFFAYQDQHPGDDLLLNINSGVFYEFIPLSQIGLPNTERIPLEQVKAGIDYALVITSNAGLYAYSIGDTVRFTNTGPYRIKVTGRITQFISAFGEHVIASEVEGAMAEALRTCDARVTEFTVAPLMNVGIVKPQHEWLIEFDYKPISTEHFATVLDNALCKLNLYYNDLISGNVLNKLKISELPRGTFDRYMKHRGILGGQNKVPRLTNNRKVADGINFILNQE